METWTDFCSESLIDKIFFYFTEDTHKNPSVIKLNSENLAVNGDLHFLSGFYAWTSHVTCDSDCASILQHFAHTYGKKKDDTYALMVKEVFDQLISNSNDWAIRIQRCTLQKERVCIFLNRADIIPNAIRMAIECGIAFGKSFTCDKRFALKYQFDTQSDLTTQRLHLMKNVTAKILYLHGYRLSDEDCVSKYVLTTKSEGAIEEGYEKYVCGVVQNSQSNSKEKYLEWEQYIKCKIDQLACLNEHKLFENERVTADKDLFLHNMANAIVTFEFMAVKPNRPVVIRDCNFENDRSITNTRGASFVLYNTARIATIIAKYNEKVLHGDYPSLPNIEDIDFSQLHEEDEWELVYNFIFGYPQMLKDCLRFKPNFEIHPQKICMFLSRLCQKFSIYYRKIRILTEGCDHLIFKMFARLYMLRALQIVFENALNILDIKSVSRM